MNLELTPEMAVWAVEHGCFVVDGMELEFPSDRIKYGAFGPPAALVALTEPCDTCGGFGYHPHHRMEWHDIDCDTCEGRGYPLLTATTECPSCEGKASNRHEHDPDEWEDCPNCVNGRVPAFTARVTAVLPVVGPHHQRTEERVIKVVGGMAYLCQSGERQEMFAITGDQSDTRPGQYVVMCEVVTCGVVT